MIERSELLTLVPHKGKMFLLSRITEYDITKRTMTSEYEMEPSCLFYDAGIGGIPAWVSFEFMAQSISALSGLRGRAEGREPRTGVILSVSNLAIHYPVIKSKVIIYIAQDVRIDTLFTFNCSVHSENKEFASAKLTVMEIDNLEEFLTQGGIA
jgi:predicted hotdog family 3-hydroxylacyl-ACP dehydratase